MARLPTGIDALDRQLEGGLPGGSIVAYCAPPASQSELLLYEMTSARETLYLSTERTEDAVAASFEQARCPTGDPPIRYVAGDMPLETAQRVFRSLVGEANLVIDPVDPLERVDDARYRNFLNELRNHMVNTGGVAVLHCLSGEHEPEVRSVTQYMADVILDLETFVNGNDFETRLSVPKFRGGVALSETIKLELGDRVRVDTSRDIA
jgi:KaiC/GvpD/RAD55 family RecA-like ATPase